MPRAGFHNDNEYRAYPFIFKKKYVGTELPTAIIVDCGFIMGLDSEYDPAANVIYLQSIGRTAETFEFVFKTNAPNAVNLPITFSCPISANEWQTIPGESEPNTDNNFCAEEPAWEGFITIGKFDELLVLLPTIGVVEFYAPTDITDEYTPDYIVEPSRAQSLVRAYVRAISAANYARPRVPSCDETGSSSSSNSEERQIIINATCLRGDIKLKAGYNCAINQTTTANTITVNAFKRDRGVNDPNEEICRYGSELALYEGHVPAEGDEFLSGGPTCADLITSINGIGGPNVTIAADPGIQIVSIDENSIKIGVTPNIIQQNCG